MSFGHDLKEFKHQSLWKAKWKGATHGSREEKVGQFEVIKSIYIYIIYMHNIYKYDDGIYGKLERYVIYAVQMMQKQCTNMWHYTIDAFSCPFW